MVQADHPTGSWPSGTISSVSPSWSDPTGAMSAIEGLGHAGRKGRVRVQAACERWADTFVIHIGPRVVGAIYPMGKYRRHRSRSTGRSTSRTHTRFIQRGRC